MATVLTPNPSISGRRMSSSTFSVVGLTFSCDSLGHRRNPSARDWSSITRPMHKRTKKRNHLFVCETVITPLSPSIAIAVFNAAERLRRFSRSCRAFAPSMRAGWNSFES